MISSNLYKKSFFYLLIFCLVILNCSKIMADEKLTYVQASLGEEYIHYNDVISKYGEIWIGYTRNKKILNEAGDERFIIEKAYYYYKKDNNLILLGYLDKTGLYDKNGTCIKTAPKVASGYSIVGISSLLLEDILGPSLILQSQIMSDYWRETDTFVVVDIDTQQDTLILMDMSRFLE